MFGDDNQNKKIPININEYLRRNKKNIDNLLLEKFKPVDFYYDDNGIIRNNKIPNSNLLFVIYTGYTYIPIYNSDIDEIYKKQYTQIFKGIYYDDQNYFINPLKWGNKIKECLGDECINL